METEESVIIGSLWLFYHFFFFLTCDAPQLEKWRNELDFLDFVGQLNRKRHERLRWKVRNALAIAAQREWNNRHRDLFIAFNLCGVKTLAPLSIRVNRNRIRRIRVSERQRRRRRVCVCCTLSLTLRVRVNHARTIWLMGSWMYFAVRF